MIIYELSRLSKLDLEEIWVWTLDNFSINQADYYIENLIYKIEEHCKHLDNKIVVEQHFLDYKYVLYQSHYIFYLKTSENKISIVRVLHQNRNITRILKNHS
ncbi:type II toxin-antitoxin system RelE/ParE family toxin [Flavobacterium gelidilacus]|jgi:toxin ParE1/3/4|uniref:type II toxin-antitoxin system RelE/ParE family toxin n=1 Tax=Flavobacterium gelidilacus TaxID=206041 RepID=UPI000422A91F|nr:type II toxin-antitoxin system RelE/ParE family toxin [Flavobacterium gelidilacus]